MRKVVIPKAGGHDRLTIEEHPDPAPAPGEVLIAVEAIGINYADAIVRMGLYASAKVYVGWPITPGFEVAGTVAALGEGVSDLAIGAKVLAVTRFGGYATRVALPRRFVFALPAGWTVAQGAAFPAVHMTAWFALCELAHPRKGARTLVHSAAGGVGSALLALGKILGLRTVGIVGGPHKVEAARKAGADDVIDKSSEPLWKAAERISPEGYDLVLDANGVETLKQSWRHLAPAGKLVIYGFHSMFVRGSDRPSWLRLALGWLRTPSFNPLEMTSDCKSAMAFNLSFLFENKAVLEDAMTQLLGWVADGRLGPPQVTTFPFEKVAEAHAAIESGKTTGKLVLTCG